MKPAQRPQPPDEMIDELAGVRFVPAPDLRAWVFAQIIQPGGALHNPEHAHMAEASLGFLWASGGFVSKGRIVAGMAEDLQLSARGNAWQRGRADQQIAQWFQGEDVRFLVTIDARYASVCDDAAFCALIEHELYHCAQVQDEFGSPVFQRDGLPKLAIRGHDVEEFVGVVRRYGTGDPDSSLSRLVRAAAAGPRVAQASIVHACGTCLARA